MNSVLLNQSLLSEKGSSLEVDRSDEPGKRKTKEVHLSEEVIDIDCQKDQDQLIGVRNTSKSDESSKPKAQSTSTGDDPGGGKPEVEEASGQEVIASSEYVILPAAKYKCVLLAGCACLFLSSSVFFVLFLDSSYGRFIIM